MRYIFWRGHFRLTIDYLAFAHRCHEAVGDSSFISGEVVLVVQVVTFEPLDVLSQAPHAVLDQFLCA